MAKAVEAYDRHLKELTHRGIVVIDSKKVKLPSSLKGIYVSYQGKKTIVVNPSLTTRAKGDVLGILRLGSTVSKIRGEEQCVIYKYNAKEASLDIFRGYFSLDSIKGKKKFEYGVNPKTGTEVDK